MSLPLSPDNPFVTRGSPPPSTTTVTDMASTRKRSRSASPTGDAEERSAKQLRPEILSHQAIQELNVLANKHGETALIDRTAHSFEVLYYSIYRHLENTKQHKYFRAINDIIWNDVAIDGDCKALMDDIAAQSSPRDWSKFFQFHLFLREDRIRAQQEISPKEKELVELQKKATELSWNDNFIGSGVKALYDHVVYYIAGAGRIEEGSPDPLSDQKGVSHVRRPKVYAAYTSIIQSSGMGKSRLINEFGLSYFLIPLNLHGETETAYPPRDANVHDYLAKPVSCNESFRRSCKFLIALFSKTTDVVRALRQEAAPDELDQQTVAQKFHEYMVEGQSMTTGTGPKRTEFYDEVIQNASNMNLTIENSKTASPSRGLTRLEAAFDTLEREVCGTVPSSPSPAVPVKQNRKTDKSVDPSKIPTIYIGWDEAHSLTKPFPDSEKGESNFSELRRALRYLIGRRLFSFFLSTNGKISQFTSPSHVDPSSRVSEGSYYLIPPFSDLGFDQHVRERPVGSEHAQTLSDVTALEYAVRFGRPLWGGRYHKGDTEVRKDMPWYALMKLLCENPKTALKNRLSPHQQLSCLSQRFCLDMLSTSWTTSLDQQYFVENHMRVCVKVGDSFENLITLSSSEVLLAEVSACITYEFDIPEALKTVLRGFSINKGDRGELLAMVLVMMARDASAKTSIERLSEEQKLPTISVPELFSSLFKADVSKHKPTLVRARARAAPFNEVFEQSRMHFNHFIKIRQWGVLRRQNLPLFIARGAGILCANNQPGVDFVIPFLFEGGLLGIWNASFILVQVKNDPTYGDVPDPALFDLMDPVKLKIFSEDEKTRCPIIRIVFALAAKKPGFTLVKPSEEPSTFTSYDYWCAGLDPKYLQVITGTSQATWEALLQASQPAESIFRPDSGSADAEACRRHQNPAAGLNPEHWSQFADIERLKNIKKRLKAGRVTTRGSNMPF